MNNKLNNLYNSLPLESESILFFKIKIRTIVKIFHYTVNTAAVNYLRNRYFFDRL